MEQPAAAPREVTVDEAIALAIRCQKEGRLAEAEALYRKVLELEPDQPAALHYPGVLAHQQGRSEEAIALIARSLDFAPDQPDWHSNLGIVLKSKGKLQEAVVAYRRALALDPTHANAQNNIGVPVSGSVPSVGSYNCTGGGNSLFSDVLPTDGGCRFIHYIYADGVTAGCGGGKYCPTSNVTRWQMAPFLVTAFRIPSSIDWR